MVAVAALTATILIHEAGHEWVKSAPRLSA
jgi:membrane-associated protease RseP (regulator of RpoE activity)